MITGANIALYSGTYFDFEAPEASEFTIFDVAHALSNLCRFTGHCARFYSVAQHSVHVSQIVPAEDAFAGLMHDAPEAFTGDVSKPLKSILPDFRALEDRIERAVFERFGLPAELPASVKDADLTMLVTEQCQIMRTPDRDQWATANGAQPLTGALPEWSPAEAMGAFLARYAELRRSPVMPVTALDPATPRDEYRGFAVGDTVRVCGIGSRFLGVMGRVVVIDHDEPKFKMGVELDDSRGLSLHSCGGHALSGTGWYFNHTELERIG